MTSPMTTMPLLASANAKEACSRFLDAIGAWITACIEEYADPLTIDNHDQGTYMTSWLPYIQARSDERASAWMIAMRDHIARHHIASGAWYHGYWKRQEAHHGTEHFELFLGALWRLAPEDPETHRQMLDAAEHIGNWSPDVPAWYDWEKHCFRSWHLGTEVVDESPPARLNRPDHLRFANIAMLAWQMSSEPRYLEVANDYAGQWARGIVDHDAIPLGLDASGPVFAQDAESFALYRQYAGAAPLPQSSVTRAENLLASDAINLFLQLWKATSEPHYRQAVEKLMVPILTQLAEPDATAAAAAVRDYRRATGDQRYDEAVLAAADHQLASAPVLIEGIEPEPVRDNMDQGIGKRKDMPAWFENGHPRAHNEALLALAAELRGDHRLATVAIDLARTRFDLARQVYPHGRHHGCSARTVNAIARGHGRENHAGTITAVLAPMLNWLSTQPVPSL